MSTIADYLAAIRRTDPRVTIILTTGIGVIASAAFVLNGHLDFMQAAKVGLGVLVIGAFAFLVMNVVTNQLIELVLSWFMALITMATFIVFFLAAVFPGVLFPPIACLLQPQRNCRDVLDAQAARLHDAPEAIAAQPVHLPPAVVHEIPRGSYRVDVQFAGVIRREDVVRLSTRLHDAGWGVPAADVRRGGERTPDASGYNEVRYGPAADRNAAVLLAHLVEQDNLTGAPITVASNPGVKAANLEVWLSL